MHDSLFQTLLSEKAHIFLHIEHTGKPCTTTMFNFFFPIIDIYNVSTRILSIFFFLTETHEFSMLFISMYNSGNALKAFKHFFPK